MVQARLRVRLWEREPQLQVLEPPGRELQSQVLEPPGQEPLRQGLPPRVQSRMPQRKARLKRRYQ